MREMKDSGVEWIGEIPKDWEIVPTKRFFRNIKRVAGKEADNYERLALTMNGVIKRSKEDSGGLQPEKFEGYQILQKNELVFKLIDLENIKTSRVGLSSFTGLVSPAYIVLTNESEDNRFYYYWFMFLYYNEIFNHLGGDGVRSALNAKDLAAIPVVSIPIHIQYNIANYLDEKCTKIDTIIATQQKIIERLRQYRLSVISEMVTDSSFSLISLGKCIDKVEQGWSPSPSEKNQESDWHVLSLAAVKEGRFNKTEIKPFSGDKSRCERLKVNKGDFLLTRSNTRKYVGAVCLVDSVFENTIFSDLIYRIIFNTRFLLPSYALYYFQSAYARQQIERDAHGSSSTMVKITHKDISNWKISLPSIERQKVISKRLHALDKAVMNEMDKRILEINKLMAYKKSLIYEVVTGKREV